MASNASLTDDELIALNDRFADLRSKEQGQLFDEFIASHGIDGYDTQYEWSDEENAGFRAFTDPSDKAWRIRIEGYKAALADGTAVVFLDALAAEIG